MALHAAACQPAEPGLARLLSGAPLPAGHLLLTRAASVGAVQRITCAYMAHSPSLVTDTELRHLGAIAALLFAVMGAEEEAFFTLLALVEDRLPASCILQARPLPASPCT